MAYGFCTAVMGKRDVPHYRKPKTCSSGFPVSGLAMVKKTPDRMKFSFALENAPEGVLLWVDLPLDV